MTAYTSSTEVARRIIEDIVIQHDSFHQVMGRMDMLWRDAQARIPIVAPFIGESGTGKSTAIKTFLAKHPPSREPDGLVVPVLSVQVPSKPSPRALAERILWALGDPRPTAGSAAAKLDRIVVNFDRAHVLVLLLDDVQGFVDKRQQIALYDSSDYLKELLVSYELALFCFGLPECELLIMSNEQLQTRCCAVVELKRFDWMAKVSQNQFVGVLAAFQRGIVAFEFPELASPELSLRMYLASGGLMRNISTILSTAIRNAIDNDTNKIRLHDLAVAWSQGVYRANKEYPNPFGNGFKLNDLPTKIALAKTIGQRVDRPQPVHSRKPGSVLADLAL